MRQRWFVMGMVVGLLLMGATPVRAVQFGAGTGSSYPASLDTVNTRANPGSVSCSSATATKQCAEWANDLQDAVVELQTFLGTSVAATLAATTKTISAVWTFSAGLTVSGGQLEFADGTKALPGLASSEESGFYRIGAGSYGWSDRGTTVSFHINGNSEFRFRSTVALGWSSGEPETAGSDLTLVRDAANTLAQKNGTTAQEFRVYGTTTGSKYAILKHDGTNTILGSSSGALKADSTAITPATTGTRYLCISTTGVVASSASACSGT